MNFDSNKEGVDYQKEIRKFKREHNQDSGYICFKQVFTSEWLRKANEYLQSNIDHKRIWFGSKTVANTTAFNKYSSAGVDLKLVNENKVNNLAGVPYNYSIIEKNFQKRSTTFIKIYYSGRW